MPTAFGLLLGDAGGAPPSANPRPGAPTEAIPALPTSPALADARQTDAMPGTTLPLTPVDESFLGAPLAVRLGDAPVAQRKPLDEVKLPSPTLNDPIAIDGRFATNDDTAEPGHDDERVSATPSGDNRDDDDVEPIAGLVTAPAAVSQPVPVPAPADPVVIVASRGEPAIPATDRTPIAASKTPAPTIPAPRVPIGSGRHRTVRIAGLRPRRLGNNTPPRWSPRRSRLPS